MFLSAVSSESGSQAPEPCACNRPVISLETRNLAYWSSEVERVTLSETRDGIDVVLALKEEVTPRCLLTQALPSAWPAAAVLGFLAAKLLCSPCSMLGPGLNSLRVMSHSFFRPVL